MGKMEIDWQRAEKLIDMALEEDFGDKGDVTTNGLLTRPVSTKAVIKCKEDCVCAGLEIAKRVFHKLDASLKWVSMVKDGDFCVSGTIFASLSGNAAAILSGERTALNFLQHLCGIATTSRKYYQLVKNCKTKILDTRKTTPGWRNLEKYAVRMGGCRNHRIGLYDRAMVKDNHREIAAAIAGKHSIKYAVKQIRKKYPNMEIEVEVDSLTELEEAIEAGADYILLDNMSVEMIKKAVNINSGKSKLEASGGITADKICEIANTGVDFISVGALTHSVKAIDISMEFLKN